MMKRWANAQYTTSVEQNNEEGWVAVVLSRQVGSVVQRVGRVVFWDADGQFALEMSVAELPLGIVEELIAEAKHVIKIT